MKKDTSPRVFFFGVLPLREEGMYNIMVMNFLRRFSCTFLFEWCLPGENKITQKNCFFCFWDDYKRIFFCFLSILQKCQIILNPRNANFFYVAKMENYFHKARQQFVRNWYASEGRNEGQQNVAKKKSFGPYHASSTHTLRLLYEFPMNNFILFNLMRIYNSVNFLLMDCKNVKITNFLNGIFLFSSLLTNL